MNYITSEGKEIYYTMGTCRIQTKKMDVLLVIFLRQIMEKEKKFVLSFVSFVIIF